MLKGVLEKLEDRVLGGRSRSGETDRLEGIIRDLDASLGDLRKEIKGLRGRLDAVEARLPAAATDVKPPLPPRVEAKATAPEKTRGTRRKGAAKEELPQPTPAAAPSRRYLRIREDDCIACGTCVAVADSVFAMPVGQKAKIISQDAPVELLQAAVDACPVACIVWADTP
jgi:ferredoxin